MLRDVSGTAPRDAVSRDRPIAVYVHWPFCHHLCPYCDFNVHIRDRVDHDAWRRALLRELDHFAALVPDRTLTSVFFGGGTPSLMRPETVEAILSRAGDRWRCDPALEISLEANPEDSDSFAAFADVGVTRLSLGVQALDDDALVFLGRRHDTRRAIAAIEEAQRRCRDVSIDLIYVRPRQTLDEWEDELRRAVRLGTTHLSLYQLTIEPRTSFYTAARRGTLTMPDDDHAASLFELSQGVLSDAGLPAYEISNHARPGHECRHNLTYWTYGDYIGIGPGAHGRLTIDRTKHAAHQIRKPERWLDDVARRGHGTEECLGLAQSERIAELLIMGLRLTGGIPRGRFRDEAGADIEAALDPAKLAELQAMDLLILDHDGLRATSRGRQRLDAVLSRLLG